MRRTLLHSELLHCNGSGCFRSPRSFERCLLAASVLSSFWFLTASLGLRRSARAVPTRAVLPLKEWRFATYEFDNAKLGSLRRSAPLAQVAAGLSPSVIIKGFLKPEECAAVLKHSAEIQSQQGYTFLGASAHQHFLAPYAATDKYFAELVPASMRLWNETLGADFIPHLQRAIGLLTKDKIVRSAVNRLHSYNPVVVRFHGPGAGFQVHYDSIRAYLFDEKKEQCGIRSKTAELANSKETEMHTYSTLLSGILVLQTPVSKRASTDTTMYDLSEHEVLSFNCETFERLQDATHHQIGVNIPSLHSLLEEVPRSTPELHQGDLFIFNSNKVHVVNQVVGQQARVTLGFFLSYDKRQRDILMWA